MEAYMFVTGLLAFVFIMLMFSSAFFEGHLGNAGVYFVMLLLCWTWPLLALYLLYKGIRVFVEACAPTE